MIKLVNYLQYCGTQIREYLDSNIQTQLTQLTQTTKPADPSNPYEMDNPNPPSNSLPPPMYSGVHGEDDDVGLAIGAALLFGRGRRIYRRRRRRSIFF